MIEIYFGMKVISEIVSWIVFFLVLIFWIVIIIINSRK